MTMTTRSRNRTAQTTERIAVLLEVLDEEHRLASDPITGRLLGDALGSARWLAYALERHRFGDAKQARSNLAEAVAPLRVRAAGTIAVSRYLAAVDELLALMEAEMGGELAQSEAELAALRAGPLLRQLEAARGEPDVDVVLALDGLSTYLRERCPHAPDVGPWIQAIDLAMARLRRKRRSATMMVTGVLNDVVLDDRTVAELEGEDTQPG
jgi:hypothetical protein